MSEIKYCPFCDKPIEDDTGVCGNCGLSLGEFDESTVTEDEKITEKKGRGYAAAIIVTTLNILLGFKLIFDPYSEIYMFYYLLEVIFLIWAMSCLKNLVSTYTRSITPFIYCLIALFVASLVWEVFHLEKYGLYAFTNHPYSGIVHLSLNIGITVLYLLISASILPIKNPGRLRPYAISLLLCVPIGTLAVYSGLSVETSWVVSGILDTIPMIFLLTVFIEADKKRNNIKPHSNDHKRTN